MHTLIYLTGEQGSGKSTLCGLMRKALEIEFSKIPSCHYVKEKILQQAPFCETVIITAQFKSKDVEKFLNSIAEHHKFKFYSINLTKSKQK
jgi:ATPase subunit of ABC transporter with duplicated ATPase domains